jgi:hypothetical protein
MSLYGPDSDANLIAQDDDSGAGMNPKIITDLSQGTYYLRVQHYDSEKGTGRYKIKVVK